METSPADRGEPLVRLVGWSGRGQATGAASAQADAGLTEAGRFASIAAIAVASAAGEPAIAGPGDLDPAFGDVGRVVDLGVSAQLWSLEVPDDESIQFAETSRH